MSLATRFKQSSLLAGIAMGLMSLAPEAAAGAPSQAPEAAAPEEKAHVRTQGRGEARARPDAFRLSVGVEAEASTVAKAVREVNTKMTRVLQELNRLEIEGLVLQTEALDIQPIRDRPETGEPPKIVGYRASNRVTATVRGASHEDLGSRVSKIVDTSVRAGANEIGGITFFLSDPSELQREALQAAVKDAERNARAMADAAGVSLGALESLDGSPDLTGGPLLRAAMFEAAPTPIETGEVTIRASVAARFALRRQ